MKLPELCIRRPVFATVLSLILIIFGIMSYKNLVVNFFPNYSRPSIRIETDYNGASAALMETSVTTPIEKGIASVNGIRDIISHSKNGVSTIRVHLRYGYDVTTVSNEIRQKIAQIQGNLPSDMDTPKVEVGSNDTQLMDVAFRDTERSPSQIADYLNQNIVNQLYQVTGVADVTLAGANPYAMMIRLNPLKMKAFGLTAEEVATAIGDSNEELPGGTIRGETLNYPVTVSSQLHSTKDFNNLVIKNVNGHLIRIKDIGVAKLGVDSTERWYASENGHPVVFILVNASTTADPITVSKDIRHLLKQAKAQMPSSMHFNVAFDQATYMQSSIDEVYSDIIIAALCVIAVISLFLGSIRTALIPIVTIPICIISSFFVMDLFGFSINMLTLLAVVLSIGLVVDDAIVMLENIYRHIESGMQPLKAAIQGSSEITFAVIAMTLTLAAVYAPIGLVKTFNAIVYRSFAFTLAGTVIVSGFIALTLSPMMCSKLLKNEKRNRFHDFTDRCYDRMHSRYKKILQAVLRHRLWIIIVLVIVAIGSFYLLSGFKHEFIPYEDAGVIHAYSDSPSGSNLKYNQNLAKQFAQLIHGYPGIRQTFSVSGEGSSDWSAVNMTLVPRSQRPDAQTMADDINAKVKQIPGLDFYVFPMSMTPGNSGGSDQHAQLTFILQNSGSYDELFKLSHSLRNRLRNIPGFLHVQSNLNPNSKQYSITIKRNVAAQLGVSIYDIDKTIHDLVGGRVISHFAENGFNYDVFMQAQQKFITSVDQLKNYSVMNSSGKLVPLSNLINITPVLTSPSLHHYNRLRSAEIAINFDKSMSLGEAVQYLNQRLPSMLPSSAKYTFIGKAQTILESNNTMNLIYITAAIFIYLVLAAQFESFIDPFIILIVVPLSIVGALACLRLVGGTLNIYTDIGLVTLIGLIAKHGILITQFANELRHQGQSVKDAVIHAATIRLRPIIMTTVAMIVGALPLVLATGANSNSRMQIGIVIIGGLFFGTFFSLIVVPIMYSYAAKLKKQPILVKDHRDH